MFLSRDLPGELSRLHVVPASDLVPLTATHPRHIARLAEWIRAERCLRHPLLVTHLSGSTVVLDGNARLAAAARLNLPDLLVQRIPEAFLPDPLRLPSMLVTGVSQEELERVLDSSFVPVKSKPSEALTVYLPGGRLLALVPDGVQVRALWEAYRRIITSLQANCEVVPLSGSAASLASSAIEPNTAVVVPPLLPVAVLQHLLERGTLLPWGSLQAPFSRRILGIHLSLSVLSASEPPEEKTDFVRELVRLRMSERKVHLYDAPVYLFEP